MGKKYIVEIGRLERLYKAFVNENGKPNMTWLSPEVDLTPYTEPDLEQIRCQAYEEGRNSLLIEVQKAGKNTIKLEEDEYYQRGLSDAWEAARKIIDCAIPYEALENYLEIGECTADVIKHLPASKAIEVVRQYEQEKEEIQVGDEVVAASGKAVVLRVLDVNAYYVYKDATWGVMRCEELVKTGRHFPEIAEVFEKMQEVQGE